jgi:hypothetical protein
MGTIDTTSIRRRGTALIAGALVAAALAVGGIAAQWQGAASDGASVVVAEEHQAQDSPTGISNALG